MATWQVSYSVSILVSLVVTGCSTVQTQENPLVARTTESSGYPYITDNSFTPKIELAVSADTAEDKRFQAVRALAISGYTKESARGLTTVACDRSASDTTRGYAAMGLRNFTTSLPAELKRKIQEQLRGVMADEKGDTPDGVIRTLISWGDAPFVHETSGTEANEHPMAIEILAGLPDKNGVDRLWELYESCPKRRWSYFRRSEIGRALVKKRDTRGIDILMALLPSDKAPSGQHRHNVFKFLAIHLGHEFGYNALNYSPALNEATDKMLSWWDKNKKEFVLDKRNTKQ